MTGALQSLLGHVAGGTLLWIVALGLACFAGWRLLQAFFDADQFGSSLYGLIRRAGFAASGLFYITLSATTVQTTFVVHAIDDNRAARDWTHWALSKPIGHALVGAIAIGFCSIGIALIVKLLRAPYRRRLQARLLTREQRWRLGHSVS